MEKIVEIRNEATLLPAHLSQLGFTSNFDWTDLFNVGDLIIGLTVNNQLVGLIAFSRNYCDEFNHIDLLEVAKKFQKKGIGSILISAVMLDSFEQGFDGFVNLTSKTNGVEQFYVKLGAQMLKQNMIFDTQASQIVINKNFSGRKIIWNTKK